MQKYFYMLYLYVFRLKKKNKIFLLENLWIFLTLILSNNLTIVNKKILFIKLILIIYLLLSN